MENHSVSDAENSAEFSTERSAEQRYVLSDAEGLQLQPGRNLGQAIALLAFAAVGAVIGYSLNVNRPDLAALAGGIVGAILGTLLSGFVLMLSPPLAEEATLAAYRNRYRQAKRRMIVSAVFGLGIAGVVIALARFGPKGNAFDWFLLGASPFILYANALAHQLREWNCPKCGHKFRKAWTECEHCGLAIDAVK